MENQQISEQQKNIWVSLTGYRTLFIFKLLLEKGRTTKELISILEKNKITQKSLSIDTIRITINTLKAAGCEISRPNKGNKFKYELISHPFNLNFTPEELEIFLKFRERLCATLTWQQMFQVNDLYDKISYLTKNNDYIEEIQNTRAFPTIKINILNELLNPKLEDKKVQIRYFSPQNGAENLDIIPYKIRYENNRLYLWCFNFKYQQYNLLYVDRILKINSVSLEKYPKPEDLYEVVYKLQGSSMITFKKKDYETVVENTKDYIIVKAAVQNEFWFIQRILQFGSDFKIESPYFFKKKLKDKLEIMRSLYK